MRVTKHRDVEADILTSTFKYLVNNGLENISIRELCKATGISQGSIYYWFEGKTELVLAAAEYGLKSVVNSILNNLTKNIECLEVFFDSLLEEISEYKLELRFIYQLTTSPQYGDLIRNSCHALNDAYASISAKLAESLNAPAEEITPLIYLTISVVLDYVVWDEYDISKMQIKYIYNSLMSKAGSKA